MGRPTDSADEAVVQPTAEPTPPADPVPRELGGRKSGPEPTRYGDWEKGGRCIDF